MITLSYATPIRTDLFQEQIGVVYKTSGNAPSPFVIVARWETGGADE
jgi:hypothetical protein